MKDARPNSGSNRDDLPPEGFTLVELMVVVAVIGLLAAIAVPAFARVRARSQNSRFIADLRAAKGAFIQYSIERGTYPPDRTPGIVPPGMDDYLGRFPWTETTSIGGQWDWDYQQFNCKAGVSVYQPSASVEQMQQIDGIIDDGDLSAGTFRTRSSGYISILE